VLNRGPVGLGFRKSPKAWYDMPMGEKRKARTMRQRACIVCLAIAASTAWAQVPQLINYQGRIVDNGTNFTGTGLFEFALVNPGATTNYWSNDGTSAGRPALAVSLTVTKGLYSVLLGDTTVSNMTVAVPPAVFTNSTVLLRVWFNDGSTNGFQQLSPDQRIAAVGFALMAANVPDGSITSNKIAAGTVMTGSQISNNFFTASQGSAASSVAASANALATTALQPASTNSLASTNFVISTVAAATNISSGAVPAPQWANTKTNYATVIFHDLKDNTTSDFVGGIVYGSDLDSTDGVTNHLYSVAVATATNAQNAQAFAKVQVPYAFTNLSGIVMGFRYNQGASAFVMHISNQQLASSTTFTANVTSANSDYTTTFSTSGTFLTNNLSGAILEFRWDIAESSTSTTATAEMGISQDIQFIQP
jgi:hypothetical protein